MSVRLRMAVVVTVFMLVEVGVTAWAGAGALLPILVGLALTVVGVATCHGVLLAALGEPLRYLRDSLVQGRIESLSEHALPGDFAALLQAMKQAQAQAGQRDSALLDASDRIRVLAGELVGGTDESVRGAEHQRMEADAAAQAISQMADTMHRVASNASGAADAARRANQEALQGQQVVNGVTSSIHALASEVERAASAMQTLEADTGSIGAILEVIRGIADQTNLLALNAAIEAARAGEQGRGFAVVADEVRTLAQRTQQATQEIHEMIARLQTGSSNAAKVMEEGRRQAELSVGEANRAGDSLNSITQAIDSISRMNEEIAEAVKLQSGSVDVVNGKLGRIVQLADDAGQRSRQRQQLSDALAQTASELGRTLHP